MLKPEHCYEQHRKDLEDILSDSECDQDLRSVIETALRTVPVLTLVREMELYEGLNGAMDVESREALIDSCWPFAITGAWPYRKLGVPLLELISAGRLSLAAAAYAFPQRKGKTFYSAARTAVEQGVLDKLDQCGVEQVTPQEVQQLFGKAIVRAPMKY